MDKGIEVPYNGGIRVLGATAGRVTDPGWCCGVRLSGQGRGGFAGPTGHLGVEGLALYCVE